MKFWDASAVVALLVEDVGYADALRQLEEDQAIVVWWATQVECASALIRRERERTLCGTNAQLAWGRLRELSGEWQEVLPTSALRNQAERMVRLHPLRAADALQLAAALTAAEGDPSSLDVITFDTRLKDSAAKEGFRVL